MATIIAGLNHRQPLNNENREDRLKTRSAFVALILAAVAASTLSPRAFAQEFSLRAAHYFKKIIPGIKGWCFSPARRRRKQGSGQSDPSFTNCSVCASLRDAAVEDVDL